MKSHVEFYKHFVVIFLTISTLAFFGCERPGGDRKKINPEEVADEKKLKDIPIKQESEAFLFGFDLRASPQEDARQYIPFINYLEKATGLDFELCFTPSHNSIVDDLGRGDVHFAASGAGSFILANKKYGVIPIVRGLNPEGRSVYKSVIIVSPQSPINSVSELRGKRFAFGNITSTQGHLIPRIILHEHNLSLDDLASYINTGSHDDCANEVMAGRVDAGGIQDTMGINLAMQGCCRIIHSSKYYPSSGIASNKDVKPEIIERVKKALLDFQPKGRDAEGLYHWERTEMPNGFTRATVEDYAELRNWAELFGFFENIEQ